LNHSYLITAKTNVVTLGLYYYLYLDWSVQALQHIGAILADWWYNSWMNAAIRSLDNSFFIDVDSSSDEDD
jgi:type V secretory pathway adhesin AidA